jgi:3-deoxy-D-manno-octulosonic-acid transferase
MVNFYDIAYYAGLGLAWPFWGTRQKSREKVQDAFRTRVGKIPSRVGNGRAVLIHAVSVGELNAARGLIEQFRAVHPDIHIIITTMTKAGDEQARKLFDGQPLTTVMRFPLDLSAPIRSMLDALRPTLVILMELEVWPNFLKHCQQRRIPVAIANGRITGPSFKRYNFLGPFGKRMFRRITCCIAQDETYGERFAALGVPRDRLHVAGTMKFDTAKVEDRVNGDDELAKAVGLPLPTGTGGADTPRDPVWIAGSTGPGEEEIVLDLYKRLLETTPALRLAIIPRKPERFDEVAALIESRGYLCVRRSAPLAGHLRKQQAPETPAVVLGDTMGELRKFYSLADVVFVGRTLVDLGPKQHGSDMIEPAALAKPVVIGPYTSNFEEPVRAFKSQEAMIEVNSPDQLFSEVSRLLSDHAAASELGKRAQAVVMAGKGSLKRHMERLLPLIE